jgi:hypothetical protein
VEESFFCFVFFKDFFENWSQRAAGQTIEGKEVQYLVCAIFGLTDLGRLARLVVCANGDFVGLCGPKALWFDGLIFDRRYTMRLSVSGVVRRSFCLLVVWTCGTIRGGSIIISSPTPPSAAAAALNVLPPFRSPACSPTRRRGRPKLEEPGHLAEGGSMNPKLRIHGDDAPSVDHMRGGRGVKLEHTKLNGHDRDSSAQGDSTPHTSRPVGRPPLWAHGQAEDYGLPEFRAHSWGESAVGAIGQDSMENAEWDLNFQKLVEHYNITRAVLPSDWEESPLYRRKGHAPPPKGTPLRAWVDTQRQLYRHGELDVRRQQRIQDIGLQLTLKGKLREVDWETMVGRLKSFYMLHGHCRVHEEEGEELLEQWVQV